MKTNEYIVIEFTDDFDVKYGITKKKNFEMMPLHETYDNCGQTGNMYECGCMDKDGNEIEDGCTTVLAWNFWSGSNFGTFILDSDFGDGVEADEETSQKILAEMPGTPWMEGPVKTIDTENYGFVFSRWADNPWICVVE